jgi:hypothetical protein
MRALLLLTACSAAGVLCAAEPALTHIHPAGVQRGTTTEVSLNGKFDPWPCRVWAGAPGIAFLPGKDAGKFEITVAADARPGPCLIRAFNDDGASAPIALVVETGPQILDREPNDDPLAPQVIETPTATINGRLDKSGDIDGFQITVPRGRTLMARVESNVLASEADMLMRVTDASGNVLAFNHDYTGMDPFIAFSAPQDGRYTVQVMGHKYPASTELQFTGGPACPYRLHLSAEPVVRNTWPLAVQRGTRAQVTLEGWNLNEAPREVDSANLPHPMLLTEVPEFTASADPQPLPLPCGVSGRLEEAGDEDRFTFQAAKDTMIQFRLTGPSHGSPIDPVLHVLSTDGKTVASSDDEGGFSEAALTWKSPADGAFTALVTDRAGKGGPEYYDHLAAVFPAPAVSASVAAHAFKVEAGKSAEVKVTVTPTNGYQKKLKLAAKDLPAGVSAAEADVPDKGGEVKVTLTAETTAARAAQPFRLVLREAEGGAEHPVTWSLASGGEDNGVPQGYPRLLINATDQLWLTVVPAPPPPAEPAVVPPAPVP